MAIVRRRVRTAFGRNRRGEMRFVARDVAEAGWGAIAKMRSRGEEEAGGGANAEGSKLAVPVVAIFGHATAPWH